jgi:hydrogenase maturation protease
MPDRAVETLVVGLGNPILTDDGVGIYVARAVRQRLTALQADANDEDGSVCGVAFLEAAVGGLRLVEAIAGYRRVILVDAIRTPGGAPGTIYQLSPGEGGSSLHANSTHDLSFSGALAWGRQIGMRLPDDDSIVIVAVEAEDVLSFGERCTSAVTAAIAEAAELVIGLLPQPCL